MRILSPPGMKAWVISGGGIDFIRVMSKKMYAIPPEQVVGAFALGEFPDGEQHANPYKHKYALTMRPPISAG